MTLRSLSFALLALSLAIASMAFTNQRAEAQVRDFTPNPFAAETVGSNQLYSLTLPLEQIANRGRVMRLLTAAASEQISFSVSPSALIQEATLKVRINNSNALIDNSQVRVLVNGLTVAQLPLAKEEAFVEALITLDPSDFRPGFNTLTFAAAQHYTLECEDPEAPELWSEIDLAESTLDVTWTRLPMATRLADLGQLIERSIGGLNTLRILLPADAGAQGVDLADAKAASMIVQRVAQQQGFAQPDIQAINLADFTRPDGLVTGISPWLFRNAAIGDQDAVVIGTVDQLRGYVDDRLLSQVTDGFVGLYPSPTDNSRFILLISGRDAAEVQRAATAVSVINFPFADAQTMLVTELDLADGFRPFANAPVRPGRIYSFADLGFSDRLFRGWRAQSAVLQIPVPGDFYVPEGTQMRVGLDFGYSNGLRVDSAMNIFLNGQLIETIPLDEEDGIGFRDFGIFVDFRNFKPGLNEVRFDTVMIPRVQEPCRKREEDALLLSLEASSTIETPPGVSFSVQPDFLSWSETGYPLVDSNGAADFDLVLADQNSATIEAAWLLLGRLSQVTGRVFSEIDFAQSMDALPSNGHAILVGSLPELNNASIGGGPIKLGSLHEVPYIGEAVVGGDEPRNAIQRYSGPLYDLLLSLGLVAEPGVADNVATTRLVQVNELGRNGLLQAVERPDAPGHLLVLATAATPGLLKDRMRELVDPAYWSQLDGNLAVWRDEPTSFAHASAGDSFEIGTLGTAERFRFLTASHPLVFVGLIFTCVLLISLIVVFAVRDLRRRSQSSE
ncbi:MAG: cellulose biosynthesis cyclic di-GMP-binding regulatory protein BcsB [Pseudomonadota bacterium]